MKQPTIKQIKEYIKYVGKGNRYPTSGLEQNLYACVMSLHATNLPEKSQIQRESKIAYLAASIEEKEAFKYNYIKHNLVR